MQANVTIIFQILTAETDTVTKCSRRAKRDSDKAGTDYEKKRRGITSFASDVDFYSDRVEAITNIIRHLTPMLFEDTGKFIDSTVLRTEDDWKSLERFVATIDDNVKGVSNCIEAATGTIKIITTSFKGVSADLNVASDRAILTLSELNKALGEYVSGCKLIGASAKKKLADAKKKIAQATV